jgi:disulfide oxidoreductase YuzD
LVANQLRRKFGDTVKVEYHDLSEAAERESHKKWAETIESKNLPVPVVTIDDQVIGTGRVDFWSIVDAIEARSKAASN